MANRYRAACCHTWSITTSCGSTPSQVSGSWLPTPPLYIGSQWLFRMLPLYACGKRAINHRNVHWTDVAVTGSQLNAQVDCFAETTARRWPICCPIQSKRQRRLFSGLFRPDLLANMYLSCESDIAVPDNLLRHSVRLTRGLDQSNYRWFWHTLVNADHFLVRIRFCLRSHQLGSHAFCTTAENRFAENFGVWLPFSSYW